MGASNVIDVLGEVVRQQHVVLQWWINMCTTRMALNCSKVQKSFRLTGSHAILESFLNSTSSLQEKLSHVRIDQCEEEIILDRNIDSRFSNFTAPSSSRFTESSCRSNLIINFDECSWFHVYPFSFIVRNRHRRQR